MKKIWKLSALAAIALFAFACGQPENSEDGFFDPVNPIPMDTDSIQPGVKKFRNPYYDWAKRFPGIVPDSVYRYVDVIDEDGNYVSRDSVIVTIDFNYSPTSATFRHHAYGSGTVPIFSTGLFAPAGEVITVTKATPDSPDVRIRINTSDNLPALNPISDEPNRFSRFPVVNATKFLYGSDVVTFDDSGVFSSTGSVDGVANNKNYFGGLIFMQPLDSRGTSGIGSYTFKGVVKAPSYKKGDDVDAWFKQMDTTAVPMFEVITDHVVWTLRLSEAYTAFNQGGLTRAKFAQLIDWYDDVTENDYYKYEGLTGADGSADQAPQFQLRNYSDAQIVIGAAHSGYPAQYGPGPYGSRALQLDRMNSTEAWGYYHELGHNFQQDSWMWKEVKDANDKTVSTGLIEVNNNFHIFHSAVRLRQDWLDPNMGMKFAAENFTTVHDDPYKDFTMPIDFLYLTQLAEVINGDKARITPFMQLAQKYGWRYYAYLGRTTRALPTDDFNQIRQTQKRQMDFFCYRLCEWTQTDLSPFFKAWGIKHSKGAVLQMMKMPNKLDMDDRWWETFDYNEYGSYEEKDTSGFQLIDNKYIWTALSGDVTDRTGWSVIESSPISGTNPIAMLIDGISNNNRNYVSFDKKGFGGNTTGGGVDPYFIVDTGTEPFIFNYMKWRNRYLDTAAGARASTLAVYGSQDNVTYTLIKDNVELSNVTTDQKLPLGGDFIYRYLKVVVTQVPTATPNMIYVGEINLGLDDN